MGPTVTQDSASYFRVCYKMRKDSQEQNVKRQKASLGTV